MNQNRKGYGLGWKQIKITNGETDIFCNTFITDKSSLNIIVTHTPITSTLAVQPAYDPLTKYPVNIFAFDFTGTGKSGGYEKDFSLESVVNDLNVVVNYIEENYSSSIHLYGNTGIGGMFAQYFVCTTDRIKSFAQFACVDYKNTAGLGYPYYGVKLLCWWLKYLPNFHINMKPPKYRGYNCEQDNAIYEILLADNPNLFKSSTKIMNAMLETYVSKKSAIKNGVKVPTLVFKTLHARYFQIEYFDRYYSSLECKKYFVE